MIRRVAIASLLFFACAKERTDRSTTGKPPLSSPVVSAPGDPLALTPGSAPQIDASIQVTDGNGGSAARAIAVRRVGGEGQAGGVEMYEDPTPIQNGRSPGADLAKQIGGAAPAKGGRSLVVVKRRTSLDPTSSLDAASMELEYVASGRGDVKKCYEALRTKAPSAKGEITLRFTIDTRGKVVESEVTGFNADLSRCVQTAMPRWKFTAPNKPARFELVLDLLIG